MSLAGLITRLQTEPIAISPEYLAVAAHAFESLGIAAFERLDLQFDRTQPKQPDIERYGSLAVIPIRGAILKHPDDWDLRNGCCDVDQIRMMAEIAAADPTIEKVLLDISSPGGSVMGVPEAGAALSRLAEAKPTAAWTDSIMASAAYWFGSQAGTIITSPSARVGSIGVYSLFTDRTGFMEKLGMKVNAISAGKFKLAGAPFKPMGDEERAMFQAGVDKIRDQFHGAVKAKRPGIKAEAMEGQCFDGDDAVKNGLADYIAETREEVIELAMR